MKKLAIVGVIVVVALAGLTQLRLATAQTPASSNKAELPVAPGAKVTGDSTSGAASIAPETPPPSVTEAVIDLSRVFKESRAFQRRQEALRNKLNHWQQNIKEEQERLAALQQEQRATSDGELKRRLQNQIDADNAALQRRTELNRKDAQDEEAVAYHESFERIRSEVAQHAKQKGIRLVRQLKSVVVPGKPVDPTDRSAVLQNLNRDIIYSDPQLVDITEAIIERLNARDGEPQ